MGAFRMMHSLLLVGKFRNAHEPVSMITCSVQVQPQVAKTAPRSASHIRPVANVPTPYPSLISKPAASRRLKPHAESTESAEWILKNVNFTKGNVGSRLGATEWTVRLLRFVLTYRNGERDSPEDAYICPNSASSEAGQIMPQIPHRPSENARKSLAGSGGRLSKSLWIGVGADTPLESRCSHKGLPSDTVFFRLVT